jgi:hypothetical protein
MDDGIAETVRKKQAKMEEMIMFTHRGCLQISQGVCFYITQRTRAETSGITPRRFSGWPNGK